MQTVLIVVHLLIVLALVGVVLLQRSEGGALGMGGGGGSGGFMTGRGQANALTRATAILGTLFFITSLILATLASRSHGPRSIFDGVTTPQGGQTQPSAPSGAPGILDDLRRLQGDTPAAPAPAAPAAPQAPISR